MWQESGVNSGKPASLAARMANSLKTCGISERGLGALVAENCEAATAGGLIQRQLPQFVLMTDMGRPLGVVVWRRGAAAMTSSMAARNSRSWERARPRMRT